MGCSESRVLLLQIEEPLVTKVENIKDQAINQKFKDAITVLKELEALRKFVVEEKDSLILSSGACCKIDPTLITIIESLLWTASKENKGEISNQVTYNEGQYPYFTLGQGCSDSSKKIAKEINEYIKKCLEYEKTYQSLLRRCEAIIRDFRHNQAKYRSSFKGDSAAAEAEIYDRNVVVVQQMTKGNTLYLIIDKLEVDLNNIKIIQSLLANTNFMNEVNSIGKKSQSYSNQYEIIYYNINSNLRYKASPIVGEEDFIRKINKRKGVASA